MAGAGRRLTVVLALAVAGVVATTAPAWAANPPHGHDISHRNATNSHPQTVHSASSASTTGCRSPPTRACRPSTGGQQAGRPERKLPNTSNPAQSSGSYWPKSGSNDPARCTDSKSTTDPGCAYDYGWSAANALTTGSRLGPQSSGGPGGWMWRPPTPGTATAWPTPRCCRACRTTCAATVWPESGCTRPATSGSGSPAGTPRRRRPPIARHGALRSHRTFPCTRPRCWVATGGNSGAAPAKCSTGKLTGSPTEMVQFLGKDGFDPTPGV